MRALVLLLLVACGDGPGKTRIRGEWTLENFETRMCQCSDPACAQKVIGDFARWSKTIRKPRDDVAETARIMDRYNACLTAAISRASRP